MSHDHALIARRLLEANRSGPPEETVDVVVTLCHPDMEFRSRLSAVEGGTYHGFEGARRYYADMAQAFREWRNQADELYEAGPGAVVVENTFRAVGRDSGIAVELKSAVVFVFSEGKVLRCVSYPTRAEALEATGIL